MTENNGRIIVADAFKHLDPNQRLAEGIVSGFSRIGIKGKNWALHHQGEKYLFVRDDDGTPLPYLDIIFIGVNANTSKMYYEGVYQDDSADGPDCASINGDVPDAGVPSPQATACGVCKHNAWLPNRGGKECQDHKRCAVLILPYMKTNPALEAPLLEPVFFKVPPNSLKTFKAYSDSLNHRGAHFASVITRVTFEPGNLFKMIFTFRQPLTNAEAPLVLPLMEDVQTRNLIGTIPEIREVAPPIKEEPQETGLMAAFGGTRGTVTPLPAPARRGRPAKAKVEETKAAAPEQTQEQENGAEAFEESDSNLDSVMQSVLSKRLSDMLK